MVYEPSDDSFLLEEQVKKLSKNKKFLDMGTGSGIQAIAAANSGAVKVVAVDIDKEAVKEAKTKGVYAIKSDLFQNVKGKFDVIVFNPPYLPFDEREDRQSAKETTGGKKGDELILRFLKQVKKHLEKNGKILLLISSLTPKEKIIKLLKQKKMSFKVLAKKNYFFESLEVLEISRKTGKIKSGEFL